MLMLLSAGKQRRKGGNESGHEFDLLPPLVGSVVYRLILRACATMSQSIALRKIGLFSQLHIRALVQEYAGIMME